MEDSNGDAKYWNCASFITNLNAIRKQGARHRIIIPLQERDGCGGQHTSGGPRHRNADTGYVGVTLENLQDDKSAVQFLKQIKPNTSVTALSLCMCRATLANDKIDDDGAIDVCDLIRMRSKTTALCLGMR